MMLAHHRIKLRELADDAQRRAPRGRRRGNARDGLADPSRVGHRFALRFRAGPSPATSNGVKPDSRAKQKTPDRSEVSISSYLLSSGGGIRIRDLRVLSPTRLRPMAPYLCADVLADTSAMGESSRPVRRDPRRFVCWCLIDCDGSHIQRGVHGFRSLRRWRAPGGVRTPALRATFYPSAGSSVNVPPCSGRTARKWRSSNVRSRRVPSLPAMTATERSARPRFKSAYRRSTSSAAS
jgi:hypothetical protein